jgi:hypothetical protein
MDGWEPASAPSANGSPGDRVRAALHGEIVRLVSELPTPALARGMIAERRRRAAEPGTLAAVRSYRSLRRRLSGEARPDPGYRHAYLALVDARVRDRVEAIYDQAFDRAPAADDAELLDRTQALSSWIASPLRTAA